MIVPVLRKESVIARIEIHSCARSRYGYIALIRKLFGAVSFSNDKLPIGVEELFIDLLKSYKPVVIDSFDNRLRHLKTMTGDAVWHVP